ncbi:MAG: histidine phosphatase family protein [Thermomicrobiales bacterium]|nr:histidine phosphatase family protein [Thermomicrobiales bacterium]
MTEFILIRHGETDWNVQGRLQGRTDIPLNSIGIEQANLVAGELRASEWDIIVSSPLQRAYQTAAVITRALGMDESVIITNADLRERSYGAVEGLTVAERDARYPDHVWPDAESTPELNERAARAIEEFAEIYAGKRVLVVSHGGWIRAVLRVVSNFDKHVIDRVIPNVSRSYVSHDGERWHIGEIAVPPAVGAVADR